MKLEKENQIDYESNTVFEGQDATIDPESMHKLFDLLQDPYKNPIGAVVREYTSNAFDSHAEAAFIKANSISDIRTEFPDYMNYSEKEIEELKKNLQIFDDDAVVVTLGKDDSGHFWSVEDFGVGLSENRVKNIFTKYLKSTKESTNNVIGAFGIGSKSGLSYTDVVHIRTRYNGEERVYILRKGEVAPRLETLSSNSTSERNGTSIKIYIKETAKYFWSSPEVENYRFVEECNKQLVYFDNVYFTGSNAYSLTNDYKILKGKNWIKNTEVDPYGDSMHLCLGKVAYPIDWSNLGIDPINIPIALNFEIGELDIIQTREDLKYTPRTKDTLFKKIEEFKKEVEDKWNEQYEVGIFTDFVDYLYARKNYSYVDFKNDTTTVTINIERLFTEEEIKDKFEVSYEPFEDIGFDSSKVLDEAYFTNFRIPSYATDTGLKHRTYPVLRTLLETTYPIYRIEGNHDSRKSRYLATEVERRDILFLRRVPPKLEDYIKYLYLRDYPKSKWREIIKAVQKASNSFVFKFTKSYQTVEIDKEWLKSTYKNKQSLDRSKFNVYVRDTSGYRDSFDTEKIRKNEVSKRFGNSICIYGNKDQLDLLRSFGDMVRSQLRTRGNYSSAVLEVIHLGVTNFKYLENLPNKINVENMKSHKLFVKYCTSRYIAEKSKLFSKLTSLSLLSEKMENVNKDISDKLRILDKYTGIYHNQSRNNENLLDSFYEECVKEGKLDYNMIDIFKEVSEYFEGLTILNYVDMRFLPEGEIALIIYRYNKGLPLRKHKRMNPNYYVNLNSQEKYWLEGTEDLRIYNKLKQLNK